MTTPLENSQWGKVIADAVRYIQSLQVIADNRVVAQRKPFVRNMRLPLITVSPSDTIEQPGSLTDQVDVGYGFTVAYIKALNDTGDTDVLGDEFELNETISRAFRKTRGWAPTLGTSLFLTLIESSDFLPPEARNYEIDVQTFVVRAWVRENL